MEQCSSHPVILVYKNSYAAEVANWKQIPLAFDGIAVQSCHFWYNWAKHMDHYAMPA